MHKGDFALIGITVLVIIAAVYVRLYVSIPSVNELLRNVI
jgi:hypothetical protein